MAIEYPRVWMNKETGALGIVTKYIEIYDDTSELEKGGYLIGSVFSAQFAGYVVEGPHKWRLILPFGFEKYYEDLGEF